MNRIVEAEDSQRRSAALFNIASRRLKNARLPVTLLCAALLAGCGDPTTAPYKRGSMDGSLDETPVTTELHTYDEDKGKASYKIRGVPLKLTFPKKYYAYGTNLYGGPQAMVILHLDGTSLRSVYDVVREKYGVTNIDDVSRKIDGTGLGKSRRPGPYRDLMTVQIDPRHGGTSQISNSWVLRESTAGRYAKMSAKDFPADKYERLEDECGFQIYGRLDERLNSEATGREFTLLNNDQRSPVKGGYCTEKPASCQLFVEYRNFDVSAGMDRVDICRFKPAYSALPAFLDQHMAYPFPRSH